MAPAGAGMPVKKCTCQGGRFGSSIMTLKRARRSAAAIAKTSAANQPKLFISWRPQKYRMSAGRHPEIDEVGERIEFGAKPRRAAQHPRDPSIQSIQNGGDNDRDNGDLELAFDRETDRGEAHAQRQQCHEIGQDDAQRHRANAAPSPWRAGPALLAGIAIKRRYLGSMFPWAGRTVFSIHAHRRTISAPHNCHKHPIRKRANFPLRVHRGSFLV